MDKNPFAENKKLLPAPKAWDEYQAGVEAWLAEQWGDKCACPYCGNLNWSVNPVVALEKTGRWPAERGPGGLFPTIPVACTKCGLVAHINRRQSSFAISCTGRLIIWVVFKVGYLKSAELMKMFLDRSI